ncbi:imelysin family protein [Simiduia agarivorans]|uniref:Imelysin n=1 Tax=Simiduia agarivorans (strain DSM 21679 / JCM 13881 / BCRC 17597 / SA1) TaxID=1117647 RepID=K4KLF2_SIMAS|nr:imelysin family protein [Simiduia agarivorans]AFU99846.1 imelysin [Simiduia agarivorans SA1 = DSM 21679]
MRAPSIALLIALTTVVACSDRPAPSGGEPATPAATETPENASQQAVKQAARDLWAGSSALLEQVSQHTDQLDQSVQSLLNQPGPKQLENARAAWHQCHNSWLAFSYQLAVIDAHQGLFDDLATLTAAIGGWPIQPGFLDYFDVYSQSGLVNDIAIPINAQSIRAAHQQFDTEDRALGLHAIAYLLWGENGQRPATDFVLATTEDHSEEAPKADELPTNRRRALLALQVNLLRDDLQSLALQWQSNTRSQLTFNRQSGQQVSELLRAAAIYLIEQQLINQQLQPQIEAPDALPSSPVPYAGHGIPALQNQLASLQQLLRDDTRLLIREWSGNESNGWRDQLAAAERSLQKLAENQSETQWIAAIASLQQLAQMIKLPDPDA